MAKIIFEVKGKRVSVELDEMNVLLTAAAMRSGCKSDSALAKKIGVSKMMISHWRSGSCRLSGVHLATILRIAGFQTKKS